MVGAQVSAVFRFRHLRFKSNLPLVDSNHSRYFTETLKSDYAAKNHTNWKVFYEVSEHFCLKHSESIVYIWERGGVGGPFSRRNYEQHSDL